MNGKGESLYSPDNGAVQRARKDRYHKGYANRRILNESVMLDALWESMTRRKLTGNMRSESPEAREKIE